MSQPANSPWANVQICNRLRELWADHSATQICAAIWDEFHVAVSRNSVIGRLHRGNLTVDQKSAVHPMTRSLLNGARRARARGKFTSYKRQAEPINIALPLNISFADIHHWQCRSITNDDTSAPLYCGHDVIEGSSYCGPHHRLYHIPDQPYAAKNSSRKRRA